MTTIHLRKGRLIIYLKLSYGCTVNFDINRNESESGDVMEAAGLPRIHFERSILKDPFCYLGTSILAYNERNYINLSKVGSTASNKKGRQAFLHKLRLEDENNSTTYIILPLNVFLTNGKA
ncbi:hypothetical protein O9G_001191 [Rozella allomycis CSF55]|uniref:Uncharacterized protein n=1 Tax=Rozella allomycis (strain CSF55) TaxID=988480 RepID=A0A075AWY6_ROZAC|nr:hypothetical protein O9G_001191 [Rozella allomycis CSF55]|eukprot:EPZ33222.1 hypothetical protein O9G_001191 [Rozella allomycis CSF55]